MKIEILGSGCPTCKKLHETVNKIVKEERLKAEVEYSDDVTRIFELGLMQSPVLIVDGSPIKFSSTSEKDVKRAILEKGDKEDKECCDCSCGGSC